jgi:2-amino-4-hydroxy-6-hydroxymethyldihydropteridine diphosphokinase
VQLPRPEINHNAFVLWPLTLLAPELVLPGTDTSCASLWQGWRGQQKVWPVAFDWHGQPLTPSLLLRQYPAQSSPAPGSGAA